MKQETALSNGFTLLDLMIVIILLGILGMTAIPWFQSMAGEGRLKGAAGELVSGLQYAANLSIRYRRPFGLKAEVLENRFRVFDNRYKDNPDPPEDSQPPVDDYGVVINPADKSWYIIDFDTFGIYDGVAITQAPEGGEIIFHPDGHSSSSDSDFVLSLSGSRRIIKVDGATGKVTVEQAQMN